MDEDYNTQNYFPSPFSRFIQNDDSEKLESINSLSDFIKVHSSEKQDTSSQPTLRLFSDSDTCDDLSSYISELNSTTNLAQEKIAVSSKPDDGEDCNTLEEYTKSFLNSKGNFIIPSRFRTQSENSVTLSKIPNSTTDLSNVNEQLSRIHISNPDKPENKISDNWNIDLSVALQNSKTKKIQPDKITKLNESNHERKICLAHVQECTMDISFLANKKLTYSNAIISSLGYVVNRKWSKLPLPKKLRKIGKNWPYKRSESFKFDTPSPDDIILRKKAKMRTNSFNET